MEKSIQDLKDEVEVLLQEYTAIDRRRKIINTIRLVFALSCLTFFVYGSYCGLVKGLDIHSFHIKYVLAAIFTTGLGFIFLLFGAGFSELYRGLFIIGDLSLKNINIIFYVLIIINFALFAYYEYYVRKVEKIKDFAITTKRVIGVKEYMKMQFENEITQANEKTAKSIHEVYEPAEIDEDTEFY
ncbi:MAG: hypothetical protein GX802_00470 [Clostridiales bacterium]|nr:hypothetical protein [Clostridiales bacterium]